MSARSAPLGVLVELRQVRGSAPREQGTCMVVTATGIEGTIGGGALEHGAIRRARALLGVWQGGAGDAGEVLEPRALGPQLGQCCGGAVTLAFSPSMTGKLVPPAPLFHLQLHGAGHVGRAVATVLATIDCAIDWVDMRADAFPAVLPAGRARITARTPADPLAVVAEAPPGAAFLVMTHSHPLDAALCGAILRRGDFAYLGLIGSATKRARFLGRWRREGIAAEAMARLVCPIGDAGIASKRPELIALGVAAELAARFTAKSTRQGRRDATGNAAPCGACEGAPVCFGKETSSPGVASPAVPRRA